MKFLIPLLSLLAAPLHAELLATFHTTQGDVVVALQYDKTPQTVANFITLAQGTRTRIDPLTGAVIRKPLYVGEKFYRVVSNDFTRIAQTGSGTGNNNGGPGYTIRDEFHPSLTHVPYVLSMANSGSKHTSGSQIFFTGNISVPEYDNSYTVFGLVADVLSREVIDSIITDGNDVTTIESVSFDRTDAAALAFNEHAQNLPVCSGIAGNLEVTAGVEALYQLGVPQAGGSIFQAFHSENLQSWIKLGEIYQGRGKDVLRPIKVDSATLPRAFYNFPLVTYPDALVPALLEGRTLEVNVSGSRTLTFVFDPPDTEGTVGGIFTDTDASGEPEIITDYYPYLPSPYKVRWYVDCGPDTGFAFECVLNTEDGTHILGTHASYEWNGSGYGFIGSGTLTLSK